MNTIDAILNRKSVKQMLPDKKVSNEEILELLKIATKTASWTNSQHWEIFVISGESLEKFNEIWSEEVSDGMPDSRPEWFSLIAKNGSNIKDIRTIFFDLKLQGKNGQKKMV